MAILLSQLLEQDPTDTLWIADENSKTLLQQGFHFGGDLLTNRWDIAQLAQGKATKVLFSDFRLDQLEPHYRRIIFPVSKEKAVVHHVINRAPGIMREHGELIITGRKNSGIKTYASKAAKYFGDAKEMRKDGQDYLGIIPLPRGGASGATLDDRDYPELRQPEKLNGLYSKPGLFGWNKVDVGSVLLAQQLAGHLPESGAHVVDLGCGYGYLCAQLAELGRYEFTATDNNAAALLACEKNFQTLKLQGRVMPSDAGAELAEQSADFVICNPPFHQGFQVEGDLTERFLRNGARVLKSGGQALYVVNEFIPLAKKAEPFFAQTELLAKENGFCVYRCSK
ncbi:class I SAM-dependent methyltransferase [Microbulbifer hainanensis]|uniref:class I SAM-dependent methyltransferase n=1 Tax=Microbulbifer hainanensis TaxID=2735675 RepID=UPI00186781AC|nr:methyltransferase [Microbulbifer hainanensis]